MKFARGLTSMCKASLVQAIHRYFSLVHDRVLRILLWSLVSILKRVRFLQVSKILNGKVAKRKRKVKKEVKVHRNPTMRRSVRKKGNSVPTKIFIRIPRNANYRKLRRPILRKVNCPLKIVSLRKVCLQKKYVARPRWKNEVSFPRTKKRVKVIV